MNSKPNPKPNPKQIPRKFDGSDKYFFKQLKGTIVPLPKQSENRKAIEENERIKKEKEDKENKKKQEEKNEEKRKDLYEKLKDNLQKKKHDSSYYDDDDDDDDDDDFFGSIPKKGKLMKSQDDSKVKSNTYGKEPTSRKVFATDLYSFDRSKVVDPRDHLYPGSGNYFFGGKTKKQKQKKQRTRRLKNRRNKTSKRA
jgi:hypothetical protein